MKAAAMKALLKFFVACVLAHCIFPGSSVAEEGEPPPAAAFAELFVRPSLADTGELTIRFHLGSASEEEQIVLTQLTLEMEAQKVTNLGETENFIYAWFVKPAPKKQLWVGMPILAGEKDGSLNLSLPSMLQDSKERATRVALYIALEQQGYETKMELPKGAIFAPIQRISLDTGSQLNIVSQEGWKPTGTSTWEWERDEDTGASVSLLAEFEKHSVLDYWFALAGFILGGFSFGLVITTNLILPGPKYMHLRLALGLFVTLVAGVLHFLAIYVSPQVHAGIYALGLGILIGPMLTKRVRDFLEAKF